MEIYILRHGIAILGGTPGYPDDDRPLTEEGIEKMKMAAKGIEKILTSFDIILTSPLKRAYETAEIVAKILNCKDKIEICKYLSPAGSLKGLFSYLSKLKGKERVLIVGHEPDLGCIASALIGSNKSVIEFKKGSLCRIDTDNFPPKETGKIIWLMSSRFLRMIA